MQHLFIRDWRGLAIVVYGPFIVVEVKEVVMSRLLGVAGPAGHVWQAACLQYPRLADATIDTPADAYYLALRLTICMFLLAVLLIQSCPGGCLPLPLRTSTCSYLPYSISQASVSSYPPSYSRPSDLVSVYASVNVSCSDPMLCVSRKSQKANDNV